MQPAGRTGMTYGFEKLPEGKDKAIKLAFQISCAVHSNKAKGDWIFFIDGYCSRAWLKDILNKILSTWNIEDPYLKFIHFDLPKDSDKIDRKTYMRHYMRDYNKKQDFGKNPYNKKRVLLHNNKRISMKDWSATPKKKGKKLQS